MESELHKFRRKKELEQKKEEIKEKVQGYWDSFFESLCKALLPSPPPPTSESEKASPSTSSAPKRQESPMGEDDLTPEPRRDPRLTYLSIGLMTLTWLLFYVAFIKIEFGAVYFTLSLLLLLYWNTRTSGRKKGEVSAYSVFNKGCESIDGTLKSEHLEKSLLYRS